MFTLKNKKLSKKMVVFCAVTLVALGGGAFAIIRSNSSQNVSQNPAENVNYDPPTKEEKQAAEDTKDVIVDKDKQDSSATNSSASLKQVKPIITDANQYEQRLEVRSFVSGVFEDGGDCTLTLSRGSQMLTKKTTGVKDATTTSCPLFLVERSEIPNAGTWLAQVKYTSTTAEGASESKEVIIK